MSSYSNSSYSSPNDGVDEDGQDTSAAAPVEEGPDATQADDPTDNVGENEVKHAEVDEENSLRHVETDGEVIGRRNEELPTENLSVPDANPGS
jgi:hypothetical protein